MAMESFNFESSVFVHLPTLFKALFGNEKFDLGSSSLDGKSPDSPYACILFFLRRIFLLYFSFFLFLIIYTKNGLHRETEGYIFLSTNKFMFWISSVLGTTILLSLMLLSGSFYSSLSCLFFYFLFFKMSFNSIYFFFFSS